MGGLYNPAIVLGRSYDNMPIIGKSGENPLMPCTILQCDMSYISEDEHAFSVCRKLISEAVRVANAMGLSFQEEKVAEKVRTTSAANKGGYTSIMMDIKNGRKTEVDTISGAVVSKAHELGIPVPYHEMAVSLVHALEGRRPDDHL